MNSKNREAITLGADVGGKDADVATRDHILAFRKHLQEECQGPYSDVLKEFAIVLRIDGSVQSWGKSGVDNIRLLQKAGYATADIFVPTGVWAERDIAGLRQFLATSVRNAVLDIAQRAQDKKVNVSLESLTSDIDRAVLGFLV
jgi:hypothetical protein